jgi:spore coat polysaccharide biosynthesis protein SpsF (cytidylyltransferase family)
MNLLDDLEPTSRAHPCYVQKRISELKLSESDSKILLAAIDDKAKWTVSALEVALLKKGIKMTRGTLDRHRSRVCGCK